MNMLERFITEVKTLPRMFYNTVENFGSRPALKFKVAGSYVTMDYQGFANVVEKAGAGLLALGLSKGDRVGLMAHTSERWAWADFSILTAGGITVTIYPTLSTDETRTIVNHCEARFLFADNEAIALRLKKAWESMSTLEKIIILDPTYKGKDPDVISLEDLLELGIKHLQQNPQAHQQAWQALQGSDGCSIIYTSGTTGDLKGSLLRHEEMMGALTRSLQHMLDGGYSPRYNDVAFSLLPLAHIWERNNSYLAMLAIGGCIGFAEKPTTLIQDIQIIKPTWVLLVPRLWDRIYSGFKAVFSNTPEGKKLFEWAFQVGEKVLEQRTQSDGTIDLTADPTIGLDEDLSRDFKQADAMVFSQLRNFLGGRLNIPYSGGGMLPAELHRHYLVLNFPLLNGWGLTETAAGISHGYPNATKIGWLSKMVPGVEAKLDTDGEILVRGTGVITEYYKNPEETVGGFTEDGWLRTGDIGEFDENGFLRIVDRKKHIIVMDTGKNVAPAKIEAKFTDSTLIDQIVIIGNDRKYISALVVPAFDMILYKLKEQGFNIDESKLVYEEAQGMTVCTQVGEEIIESSLVHELIDAEIKRVNEQLEDYESIKRYTILPRKFSEERGELTPTLKVKNQVVFEHYQDEIAALYED